MTYHKICMLEPNRRTIDFPKGTFTYAGRKPIVLLVLDGWGIAPPGAGNAVELASTPNLDRLWQTYPHAQLGASGESVGLPAGVDGNSETGHMNIGAGRVVWQSLSRINRAMDDGSFFQNQVLLNAIEYAKKHNSKLHFIGLVGPGFVHASTWHLIALLNLAKQQNFTNVVVHAFTDGRDSSPTAGIEALSELEKQMTELGVGKLASIAGRFYGMDRDRNWDRTQQVYDLLTVGQGIETTNWRAALEQSYAEKNTDEFVKPIAILNEGGRPTIIEDHDAVVFFNFRVDRPRQLTWAFTLPDFEYRDLTGSSSGQPVDFAQIDQTKVINFKRAKVPQSVYFATMTDYDKDLTNPKAFPNEKLVGNLGWALSQAGVKQLRLTETEKEKMVTYYIDGKAEDPYPGEQWAIFPSKKVKSYTEAPEMRSAEITDELLTQLAEKKFDAAIVNLSNGDMVGHTGNLQAGIQACEFVDQQIGRIVESVLKLNGLLLITADHGNAEEMINQQTGQIDTEHSAAPVPFILIGQEYAGQPTELRSGVLGDVAPTILKLMEIKQPIEMTGKSLI